MELVQYVTDEKGKKIGCLVSTGKGKIGWSICHRLDTFNKQKAREIARGRAEKGKKMVIVDSNDTAMTIFSQSFIIAKEEYNMILNDPLSKWDVASEIVFAPREYKRHFMLKAAKKFEERVNKYYKD